MLVAFVPGPAVSVEVDGTSPQPTSSCEHPCVTHSPRVSLEEAQLCSILEPPGSDSCRQTITGVSRHVAMAGCLISC